MRALPCLVFVLSMLVHAHVEAQPRLDLQVSLGPRPPPLVQLPMPYTADMVDPWSAERRARFTIAVGAGLALSSSTFLIAHPTMHARHCSYHHAYGPIAAGVAVSVGVGLLVSGAVWLVRTHRKHKPFRNQVVGETLFALGGAFVGTVSTLWLESVDSDGCKPQFHPQI